MANEANPVPAPSNDDVYDIGIPDPEATPVPAAALENQSSRESPPQDPVTGKFVSPASQPVQHPRALVRQAKELGFAPEDISEMTTDALSERVYGEMRWREQNQRQQATRQVVDDRRPAPSGQSVESAPPETIDWGQDEQGRPMSEADYAPAVATSVKKTASLEKRIAQLEAMVQQMTGREIERETNTVFDRMDHAFANMHDLKHLLGDGGRFDLDKDSAEMQRRVAVLEVAKRMAGDRATNEMILKKLPQAAKQLFGAVAKAKTVEPDDQAAVERWNGAAVAKPTHRQSAPDRPLSKKAAIEAVTAAVKERNASIAGEANGVADEDFPD